MRKNSITIKKTLNKAKVAQFLLCAGILLAFQVAHANASDITSTKVIKLVNQAREEANVPVLNVSAQLQSAAEKKAQDMLEKDYFAHVSPEGKTPWDFIIASGYDYRYAGENLAINFTDAKEQQVAWMSSELHRKNILNSDYQEIGVAVKEGTIEGHKTIVTVQEFGTQMPKAAAVLAKQEIPQSLGNIKNPSLPKVEKVLASNAHGANKFKQVLFGGQTLTANGWFVAGAVAVFIAALELYWFFSKRSKQGTKIQIRIG
jgi:uncharacterized protein YkwD